jgi:hypothetical protein
VFAGGVVLIFAGGTVADIDGKHGVSCGGTNLPQDSISYRFYGYNYFTFNVLKMVEAVGVEPTSERASNREPSCFFQFIFVSSSPLRTDKDAATTSLIDLVSRRADGAGKTSLLCDDRYRPVGEA